MKRIQNALTTVSGNPGAAVFKSGMKFPNTIIVSPMVLIHHFAFNYEDLLKRICKVLSASDTVAVDMSVDDSAAFRVCCAQKGDALIITEPLDAHECRLELLL